MYYDILCQTSFYCLLQVWVVGLGVTEINDHAASSDDEGIMGSCHAFFDKWTITWYVERCCLVITFASLLLLLCCSWWNRNVVVHCCCSIFTRYAWSLICMHKCFRMMLMTQDRTWMHPYVFRCLYGLYVDWFIVVL